MSGQLELEIGAQTRAATAVQQRITAITGMLETLAGDVASASSGFRGAASGGLAEALDAWFLAASAVPQRLSTYAASLVSVDQRTAELEQGTSQRYANLDARMGPAQ